MLKIRLFLSILLLWTALGYVSAQDSLLDGLEVITEDNAPSIEQIAEINYGAGAIRFINWSPDGTRFAVVRQLATNNVIEIWDTQGEALPDAPILTLGLSAVDRVRWLPDSQSFVTYGQYSTASGVHFDVQRWDAETGELLETLLDDEVSVAGDYIRVVPPILGWNSDYTEYIFAVDNDTVRLSNGSTFTVDNGYGVIYWVSWSPDNLYFAVLFGGSDTYHFQIIDAQTLTRILDAPGPDYFVSDAVWSPDSLTVAVASVWANPFNPFVNIRFYRIREEVRYGQGEVALSAALPDERDYDIGRQQGTLAPPPGMAWSPDSAIIAISFPTTVSLYETETFTQIATIYQGEIITLDWHPSGKLIATGNTDGTIGLWGVPSS